MGEPLTFRSATEDLRSEIGVTFRHMAERFGVTSVHFSRWRNERPPYPPPENWRAVLAQMAEDAAREHRREADRLAGLAARLRSAGA